MGHFFLWSLGGGCVSDFLILRLALGALRKRARVGEGEDLQVSHHIFEPSEGSIQDAGSLAKITVC